MAKDVRTGRPDAPLESGRTWAVARLAHFSQCFPSEHHIRIGCVIIRSVMFTRAGQHGTHVLLGESRWSRSGQPDGAGHFTPGYVRRHFISGILCADIFTSGYFIAGLKRKMLQLLRIHISGPSDNACPQNFSLNIQCNGVLLKLPAISDRHLEIF